MVSAILVIIAAALMAGGAFLLVQRETGTRARATVTRCVHAGGAKSSHTTCTGTWVTGGSVGAGGQVHVGEIDGADSGDIGKTIDVTVSGDHAYSRSIVLPLVLIGCGVLPLLGAVLLYRVLHRPSAGRPSGQPAYRRSKR